MSEEDWDRAEVFMASPVAECLVAMPFEAEVYVHEAEPLDVEELAHDLALIPELSNDEDLKPINIEDKLFGTKDDPSPEEQAQMRDICGKEAAPLHRQLQRRPSPGEGRTV
jgi:hypothetical protein